MRRVMSEIGYLFPWQGAAIRHLIYKMIINGSLESQRLARHAANSYPFNDRFIKDMSLGWWILNNVIFNGYLTADRAMNRFAEREGRPSTLPPFPAVA